MAGDAYVEIVLKELADARNRLPIITDAAEMAADRIVSRNGGLISAGDDGVGGEPVWRSGSIAFAKRYTPGEAPPATTAEASSDQPYYRSENYEEHFKARQIASDDVVMVGYENEREEQAHLADYVEKIIECGALGVVFASETTVVDLQRKFGKSDKLIPITHTLSDGGLLDVPSRPDKICPGRGTANRLNLWLFETELIGAFMRRGKIPGILLSVTYESPQIFNIPLIESYRFIPAFNVTPVKKGALGSTYLDHLTRIVGSIIPSQRDQFKQAAEWLADSVRKGNRVFAFLIAWPNAIGLPGNPDLFRVSLEHSGEYADLKQVGASDVVLYVGYNWYPEDVAGVTDKVGAKLIVCMTTVQDMPSKTAVYRTPLLHVTSLDQLPTHKEHLYIDSKFAQYDAVLAVPDYPVPAIPTSWMSDAVVYWYLVAETMSLLAKT